jgi:FkbM family methyltransferase
MTGGIHFGLRNASFTQQTEQHQQLNGKVQRNASQGVGPTAHFPLVTSYSAIHSKVTTSNSREFDGGDDHINLPISYGVGAGISESRLRFDAPACATWKGGKKGTPLDFSCKIEWDEWVQASALVHQGDVVIEFGARFGTTSCILSKMVGPAGAVVAAEPDYRVHGHLLRNLYDHRCSAVHPVLGTVSNEALYMPDFGELPNGYGAQTSTEAGGNKEELPHIDWRSVEAFLGKPINVALIDCEGCLPGVHASGLLDQIELIIMEEDGEDTDYDNIWHEKLATSFDCIWFINDTVDPNKAWSRNLRHSSWLRKGSPRTYPTCEEYRDKMDLNKASELVCIGCPS